MTPQIERDIAMEIEKIETEYLGVPSAGPARTAPSRYAHLKLPQREKVAHRLRERGFSYRRIAQELSVRYDVVSHWLSGFSHSPPPPPAPAVDPSPAAEPIPAPRVDPGLPAAAPALLAEPQIAALKAELAELKELVRGLSEAQAASAAREIALRREIEQLWERLNATSETPPPPPGSTSRWRLFGGRREAPQ